MANVDEVYATFASFGLIADDSRKTAATALAVNQHAGALNRLLQFGESSKTTKTRGSFGEGSTPQVSSAILSNMHPEIALPMERAEIGNHVGCTKERILFYTAEPVPPHSPLPAEYKLPEGFAAWTWAELDHDMASLCGLRALLADPDAAKQAEEEGQLARAQPDSAHIPEPNPDDVDMDHGVVFLPDAAGYELKLPDGVRARWRYRLEPGEMKSALAEFRVGNRDVPLPAEHNLEVAAKRVLEFFVPHTKLVFDNSAKKLFATQRTKSSIQAILATDTSSLLLRGSIFRFFFRVVFSVGPFLCFII